MTDTTTPMSVDQAVDALVGSPALNKREDNAPESADLATGAEQVSEADPLDGLQIDDEEAAETPSGDDVEDDGSEEEDQEEESQLDPIEAPTFWDADGKEKFKNLPREAQELVLAEDHKARAAVSKQIEQTSLARKAAQDIAEAMNQNIRGMEQQLEIAAATFVSEWANVDWPRYYAQNPDGATAAQRRFDDQQYALQQIMNAKQQSEQVQLQQFHQAEAQALAEMAERDPVVKKLTDPTKGQALKNEVASYLVANGVDPERLPMISAAEMALATKAKLYDDLVARQGQKMTGARSDAGTQGTKMRASASPAQPQSLNRLNQQKDKLTKSGSIDDAVNLLLMRNQTAKKRK